MVIAIESIQFARVPWAFPALRAAILSNIKSELEETACD